MTREEIIATATRIAEIRQEIAKLAILQRELKELEHRIDGVADPSPQSQSTGDPNSLVEKVVQAIDSDATRDWNVEAIGAFIGVSKLPSIRTALSKASSANRIRRRGRGVFVSLSTPAEQDLGIGLAEDHIEAA